MTSPRPHPRPAFDRARLALAALTTALASCSLFGGSHAYDDPAEVPPALVQAEELFAAGKTAEALDIARAARDTEGLNPDLRDEVERRVERYADRRIRELTERGDPGELEDLVDLDLPRQLAVTAGVRGARMYADRGEPDDAYDLIREVDRKYPAHHERVAAGEILSDVGFALSLESRGFWDALSGRPAATGVLEYLVLHYPSARRCDEAYATLARLYAEDRDWRLARERHEDLLLFHPESPYVPVSAANIPHLRLVALDSPEYDRSELVRAREELETWLARYPDHPMAPSVKVDYADCLQRLCQSDLAIAHFYRRIDEPYGARRHGERALETARLSRSVDLTQRAEVFLASVPDVSELPQEEFFGTIQSEDRPDAPISAEVPLRPRGATPAEDPAP